MKYLPSLALLAALCACSSDPHPYQAPSSKSSMSSKILGVSGALPTVEAGAPCRPTDRGACACATGPGIRSCEGGTFGECACGGLGGTAGGGGVAMLDPSGGAAGAGGGAGAGGPTGGEAGMGGGAAGAAGAAGAGAVECSPSNPCAMFESNADGTVTDQATGLTWATDAMMMQLPQAVPRTFTQTLNSDGTVRFHNPSSYCSDVFDPNLLSPDGMTTGKRLHTDWRLPTVEELQTLLDSRWPYPYTTDPHFFKLNGLYWSSDSDTFNVPWSASAVEPTCGNGVSAPCSAHRVVDFTSQPGRSIGTVSALPDSGRLMSDSAFFLCVR